MSKMKHLLRKLHIGGGSGGGGSAAAVNDHHHHHQPPTQPESNRTPSASTESSSHGQVVAVESGGDRTATNNSSSSGNNNTGADFSFFEEEFQVQLALAISASEPSSGRHVDPESAQIDAAKRISLACCPVPSESNTTARVESLSLRYWNYGVLSYNEKVMDGFYDVYGITSNTIIQGKMLQLVDFQAISISDNVNCEVTLVDRFADPELQDLEKRAYIASLEIQATDGLILSGLIQKLADIVVERMGGPVIDAEEVSRKWSRRSYELRNALNTIILPIGCLDVGLSRHRALLFKVLADKINLPCMLVKGSYHTGSDDGAINLVKVDNGSEYIIDLMGAPGALIPAEVPSSHVSSAGFDLTGISGYIDVPRDSSLLLSEGAAIVAVSPNNQTGSLGPVDERFLNSEINRVNRDHGLFRHSDELLLGHGQSLLVFPEEGSLNNAVCGYEKALSVEKPAKMEMGLETNFLGSEVCFPSDRTSEGCALVGYRTDGKLQNDATHVGMVSCNAPRILGTGLHENGFQESSTLPSLNACQTQVENDLASDTDFNVQDKTGQIFGMETDEVSDLKLIESAKSGLYVACDGYNNKIYPELREVAEWEIPWEDLQIHERIGIGSCGEVYHADWNGTEVAVKKFLDQDLSGDALVQFKYEAEIMIRLRHPNIVLFMGAVTRPPHLSILTEYLPRGSLYKILHSNRTDERKRIKMALDVAKGMNYLHTGHPVIVHRDLKTPNLLVDKNWNVKVSDFGLSRMKHHTFLSSKSTAGTPEWMAPEVLRNEPANEKCDVFSFGVILWELVTCDVPWKTLNQMQVVGAVGFQNRRLDIPANTDPVVAQIIRDCWELDPHSRPSFSQLITRLHRICRLQQNE